MTIDLPDNDFVCVLISAVRYCIGRRTYMPETVTRWIMGHCKGQLSANTVSVMIRDINEAATQVRLGDECDVLTWEAFRQWLKREGDANAVLGSVQKAGETETAD